MSTQPTLHTQRLVLVPLADSHLPLEARLDADADVMRFIGPVRTDTRDMARVHEARMRRGQVSGRPGLGFWIGFLRKSGEPSDRGHREASRQEQHGGEPAMAEDASGYGDFVGWWLLTAPNEETLRRWRSSQKACSDSAADTVFGADQLTSKPAPIEQAELGYRLRPSFWRRGLATEGSSALLRHGFGTLGLTRIYAQTMAVNVGSRATMVRLGMHLEGAWVTADGDFEVMLDGWQEGEVEYGIWRDEWEAMVAAGDESGATGGPTSN